VLRNTRALRRSARIPRDDHARRPGTTPGPPFLIALAAPRRKTTAQTVGPGRVGVVPGVGQDAADLVDAALRGLVGAREQAAQQREALDPHQQLPKPHLPRHGPSVSPS
jgi:hypothetical protein